MRFFFIRNKNRRKKRFRTYNRLNYKDINYEDIDYKNESDIKSNYKYDRSSDEDLTKNYYNTMNNSTNFSGHTNFRILSMIILSELIGALFVTYISKKHIFDIEIYSQYFLTSLTGEIVNTEKYFLYLLLRYCKETILITLLNFTSLRKVVNYIFIIYKVVFSSISLSILVIKYGVLGQLKFILTLFPQGIIYYLFFYLMMKHSNKLSSDKQITVIQVAVSCIIAIFVSALTAILETYINLKIIYKIFI